VNLGSSAARKMVSTLISTALESKGSYTEYSDSEIEEQNARATWVCSICGENTADVDYDYLGSGTNHLGCEMNSWDEIEEYVADIPDDIPEGLKRAKELSQEAINEGIREKNWLQKKHENKVFGGDTGTDADFGHDLGGPYDYKKEDLQKQAYMEMTSDGLPEGGDAQAVKESHRLAEEIVEAQEGKWIYESPDGGKTVFRRPFSDYDPKNKEEIDFKTKEPTGRKFTEYNGGKWNE